jgi:dTDP-4-amino-4,6-dideoxygalactose transaminase
MNRMAATVAKCAQPDRLTSEGGLPVREAPFPVWPALTPNEIEAATTTLRSGQLNYWTGVQGQSFEREYAAFVGTKFAVAVANGSVALELALHALGIGPGDEVVVPSRSFIASASCVVMCGAVPVFADVDIASQNVTADTIARALTPRTKAVIVVHLAGLPCDMGPIMALARQRGLKVVEDCAQAHGATYDGRQVGSFGHINAFSFCQDKILTTGGEGGLVTTDDENLWERAWSYKDHGKSFSAVYRTSHPPGYRLLHESFGTNWRMTEMQSAIGRVALRDLPGRVRQRQRNAAVLDAAFSALPGLRVVVPPSHVSHAYYKYHAFIRPERLRPGWDRHRIQAAICDEGIPCISGYREMYLEKAFPVEWRPAAGMDGAHALAETGLVFEVHSMLSDREMRETARAVEKVLTAACL